MMRKLQNTISALGRSAGGQAFRPFTSPSHSWVRIRLPSFGTSTAKRVLSSCMSGQPNRINGAPRCVSKWPSMAAILAGWCSSVLRPCWSPAKIWIGATMAAIHMAIENITRAPSLRLLRSRW